MTLLQPIWLLLLIPLIHIPARVETALFVSWKRSVFVTLCLISTRDVWACCEIAEPGRYGCRRG